MRRARRAPVWMCTSPPRLHIKTCNWRESLSSGTSFQRRPDLASNPHPSQQWVYIQIISCVVLSTDTHSLFPFLHPLRRQRPSYPPAGTLESSVSHTPSSQSLFPQQHSLNPCRLVTLAAELNCPLSWNRIKPCLEQRLVQHSHMIEMAQQLWNLDTLKCTKCLLSWSLQQYFCFSVGCWWTD